MNLKDQIDIQKLYNKQVDSAKSDLDRKDDVINDLQRKIKRLTKKDIIVG